MKKHRWRAWNLNPGTLNGRHRWNHWAVTPRFLNVFSLPQELFIDVTLSCGEHNFPAHKLVLSVCSPYFRHLFLRNPCKHPIVVLKDVHFKYMKLLLMYMYRGEVSCPQEDLHGLLRTARSLQIRGLVELERKREAEGFLCNSITGSPIKQVGPQGFGVGKNCTYTK